MNPRFTEPDYQLTWPLETFVAACAGLLNERSRADWDERCALLLDDAFVRGYAGGPPAEFRELTEPQFGGGGGARSSFSAKQSFLRTLMENAGQLNQVGTTTRRPYYRERHGGGRSAVTLGPEETVREFAALVYELETLGYYEKRFGKDCVDDSYGDEPTELLRRELGEPDLWPLPQARLIADQALFFDVIELFHDLAARPQSRWMHPFSGCGWHHQEFDISSGRKVYRWRVNEFLARSSIPMRLADEGVDAGRLVARTDDARTDLVRVATGRATEQAQQGAGHQVAHAVELFRARGADRNQKRSAITALALVLEERRHGVLTEALAKTDRGALFDIANNFHIRHQDARQQRDYDEFYLDWVFWLFLASIELTDRIVGEQAAGPS